MHCAKKCAFRIHILLTRWLCTVHINCVIATVMWSSMLINHHRSTFYLIHYAIPHWLLLCTQSRVQHLPIFYVHKVSSGCWLAVVYIVNGQQSVHDSVIYFIHQMVIHNPTKLLPPASQTIWATSNTTCNARSAFNTYGITRPSRRRGQPLRCCSNRLSIISDDCWRHYRCLMAHTTSQLVTIETK